MSDNSVANASFVCPCRVFRMFFFESVLSGVTVPDVARGGRVAVRSDRDVASLHDVSLEQHAVLYLQFLLHIFYTGIPFVLGMIHTIENSTLICCHIQLYSKHFLI